MEQVKQFYSLSEITVKVKFLFVFNLHEPESLKEFNKWYVLREYIDNLCMYMYFKCKLSIR